MGMYLKLTLNRLFHFPYIFQIGKNENYFLALILEVFI